MHPYLPLKDSDCALPRLWLGTWSLGGEGFGKVEAARAREVIESAFNAGVRHFDTAGFYAHGKSEHLLGQALKGLHGPGGRSGRGSLRSKVFISSKGGLAWEGRQVRHDASPQALRDDCRCSLQRIGSDYLDLFQLHWPDPAVPVQESLEALEDLRKEGLIRYWGAGNLSAAQVRSLFAPASRRPHQVRHSPLHRSDDILDAGFDERRAFNCVVSPFEQGMLAGGRSSKGLAALGRRDTRRRNPVYHSREAWAWTERFHRLCKESGLSPVRALLLWLSGQQSVDAIIAGPKTPEQVAGLLAGLLTDNEQDLPPAVKQHFDEAPSGGARD